ncbi:MAG: hypothetical protein ACOYMD_02750 [Paludibacter sp.]
MRQLFSIKILVFIILVPTFFLHSQPREIINKLPDYNHHTTNSPTPLKSQLPCGFYRYIVTSAIGISDVKLDSTTAYHQAYLRALSMLALQKGLARGMSDFFNDTNGKDISSNYEELCELKSDCNFSAEGIKVLNSFQLKSGEFVIFLGIDSSSVTTTNLIKINSIATIYYKDSEINGSRKIINKITFDNNLTSFENNKNHIEKTTYVSGNNRWVSNETYFDSKKIVTDRYKIFYDSPSECIGDTTGFKEFGTSTVDGLWFALVNSVYRQLSAKIKENFLKVKKLGDQYGDKVISLNRETGFFKFSFNITDAALIDNKLITKIKVNYQ